MIGQMMTLSTNRQSVEAAPFSSLIILYPAYISVCVSIFQIPDEMVVLGQGTFYSKISVPVILENSGFFELTKPAYYKILCSDCVSGPTWDHFKWYGKLVN